MNYSRFKYFLTLIKSNIKPINKNVTVSSCLFKNQFKFWSQKRLLCNSVGYEGQSKNFPRFLLGVPLLQLFNPFKDPKDLKEEEDTPENQLIMTIKRSILCMQREEYNKAEQMLHIALRQAQQLNHKDGITYVYDIMANLASSVNDYAKSEKLYVEVMKRLLGDGVEQDDNRVGFESRLNL